MKHPLTIPESVDPNSSTIFREEQLSWSSSAWCPHHRLLYQHAFDNMPSHDGNRRLPLPPSERMILVSFILWEPSATSNFNAASAQVDYSKSYKLCKRHQLVSQPTLGVPFDRHSGKSFQSDNSELVAWLEWTASIIRNQARLPRH